MRYMTLVGVLLFYGSAGLAQVPPKDRVRTLYQKAVTDKNAAQKLIKLLKPYNSNHPLLLGYKASGIMLMAKHALNPFKKLKYFKEGKNILQKAVEADKKNVELRLLRFAVQSNAPSFLGYDDHIQTDKEFLIENVPKLNDDTLKSYIISYLESSSIGDTLQKKSGNY